MQAEPQDAEVAIVNCYSVGGAELATIRVESQIETIWSLRNRIADEMKVSSAEIRLTTTDGRLLDGSHDSMLVKSSLPHDFAFAALGGNAALESNE